MKKIKLIKKLEAEIFDLAWHMQEVEGGRHGIDIDRCRIRLNMACWYLKELKKKVLDEEETND